MLSLPLASTMTMKQLVSYIEKNPEGEDYEMLAGVLAEKVRLHLIHLEDLQSSASKLIDSL